MTIQFLKYNKNPLNLLLFFEAENTALLIVFSKWKISYKPTTK